MPLVVLGDYPKKEYPRGLAKPKLNQQFVYSLGVSYDHLGNSHCFE